MKYVNKILAKHKLQLKINQKRKFNFNNYYCYFFNLHLIRVLPYIKQFYDLSSNLRF